MKKRVLASILLAPGTAGGFLCLFVPRHCRGLFSLLSPATCGRGKIKNIRIYPHCLQRRKYPDESCSLYTIRPRLISPCLWRQSGR